MNPSLLVAAGLLSVVTAHAQVNFRAGGNLVHLLADGQLAADGGSVQTRWGYQVGVAYRVPLTVRFSLTPELQVSREHMGLTLPNYGIGIPEYTYRYERQLALTYLNLPLLVRATFGPVYVEAGPQLSVRVGGRENIATQVSYGSLLLTQGEEQAAAASYRRLDGGPCLGVGLLLPAGFDVDLRAYQGLVSLPRDRADQAVPYTYPGSLRRQVLQVALTYRLPTHHLD